MRKVRLWALMFEARAVSSLKSFVLVFLQNLSHGRKNFRKALISQHPWNLAEQTIPIQPKNTLRYILPEKNLKKHLTHHGFFHQSKVISRKFSLQNGDLATLVLPNSASELFEQLYWGLLNLCCFGVLIKSFESFSEGWKFVWNSSSMVKKLSFYRFIVSVAHVDITIEQLGVNASILFVSALMIHICWTFSYIFCLFGQVSFAKKNSFCRKSSKIQKTSQKTLVSLVTTTRLQNQRVLGNLGKRLGK